MDVQVQIALTLESAQSFHWDMTTTVHDKDKKSAVSAATANRMQRAGLASRVFTGFLKWCREGESNPQDPKVGGF